MKKYRKEIVINFYDIPRELTEDLTDECSNGSYKYFAIHDSQKPRAKYKGGEILFEDNEINYITERGDDPLSDYLYDEFGLKNRENVLILISW